MHLFTEDAIPNFSPKISALTIGTFDGVHRGHLHLLNQLRSQLPKDAPLIVYTFTNHPSHILSPLSPVPLIYTLEHKLRILQENGVDYTITSCFTKEMANTPFDVFLSQLHAKLCFSYLILGEGACLGKNRQGNPDNVKRLAEKLHFTAVYIPKLHISDSPLSSTHIRALIIDGKLSQVEHYLGRPYSIYAPLHQTREGYCMKVQGLCLPPTTTYPIRLAIAEQRFIGQAHIDSRSGYIHIDCEELPHSERLLSTEIIF